jgi:hypothetical protein
MAAARYRRHHMGSSVPPPGSGGFDPDPRGPSPQSSGGLSRYEGSNQDQGQSDPRLAGPLDVFATVRTALGLYGADALKLWQTIAIVVIPVQALVFVLRAITVPSGSELINSKIYLMPGASDGGFVAVSVLGELLALLALLVSVGATYRILLGRHLHHPADLATSFSFALERALPLLWVSLLTFLVVAIGIICLILPGIYLAISLAVAVPVLMAEDRRGLAALRRARELVAGHWWHVLGAIVVAAVVAVVGEVVIDLLARAIVSGVSPHSVSGLLLINAIVSALVSILFYPFTAAVPVVLYVDMLARQNDPQLDRLLA